MTNNTFFDDADPRMAENAQADDEDPPHIQSFTLQEIEAKIGNANGNIRVTPTNLETWKAYFVDPKENQLFEGSDDYRLIASSPARDTGNSDHCAHAIVGDHCDRGGENHRRRLGS